jgi:hypothetical protein
MLGMSAVLAADVADAREVPHQGIRAVIPFAEPSGDLSAADSFAAESVSGPVTLTAPVAGSVEFGAAVATWGDGEYDYVVVGAPAAPNGQGGTGRVWVYKKLIASTLFTIEELLQPAGEGIQTNNRFGASVSIASGQVVVGAPGGRSGSFTSLTYVFRQPIGNFGFPVGGSSFSDHSLMSRVGGGGAQVHIDRSYDVASSCADGECWFNGTNPDADVPASIGRVTGSVPLNDGDYFRDVPWGVVGSTNSIKFLGWKRETVGASSVYTYKGVQSQLLAPQNLAFSSLAGRDDLVFASLTGTSGAAGQVFLYSFAVGMTSVAQRIVGDGPVNNWSKLNPSLPGGSPLPGGFPASSQFGKRIGYSGDIVLVSDPTAGPNQGIVYRFRLDRHRSFNPADLTLSAFGALNSGGTSYG